MSKWDPKSEWKVLLEETKHRELLREEKVTTWEEFKQILTVATNAKELEKLSTGGEAVGKAAKNLLGMALNGATMGLAGTIKNGLELGGQLKDVYDVVKGAGELDDKAAEKSPLFSYFNIDDGYSEIVDDRLEDAFLKWLPGWIGNKTGPIDPEMDNVNKVFEEFLKQRGDFDETVSNAGSMKKFTDLDKPKDESGWEKAYKVIDKGAKGIFSGLF